MVPPTEDHLVLSQLKNTIPSEPKSPAVDQIKGKNSKQPDNSSPAATRKQGSNISKNVAKAIKDTQEYPVGIYINKPDDPGVQALIMGKQHVYAETLIQLHREKALEVSPNLSNPGKPLDMQALVHIETICTSLKDRPIKIGILNGLPQAWKKNSKCI